MRFREGLGRRPSWGTCGLALLSEYLARFPQVRQVMMGSKLAMPVLGKIWDLSDVDRDGMLDQYEFTVAMHLVYRRVECLCKCQQCLNLENYNMTP